ncbi:unnamed protein product [Didymodactylos carnosus]|uniref:Calcineurin-like phosphoesterase domain-containing protein n=1 Tax=Didymodactylos carnosus TaxID=1234261 RepID=A0A814TGQ8_9BILA|nr:unnamed protein product [Didymodactylos carnosus]CAF1296295.1 unnamed protein product [Didymodactylos carnosus]CAF3925361.1 unnamed protein product [Didymodactylos carnosus]CAF4101403.1 unnamed protein product [Didymodactylos carnosus]
MLKLFKPSTYSFLPWFYTPEVHGHPPAVLLHLTHEPPQPDDEEEQQQSNTNSSIEGLGTESNPFIVYRNKEDASDIGNKKHKLRKLRFVCMSDTHNQIHKLIIPHGDVFLHCGDAVKHRTSARDLITFNTFVGTLPHKHKIFISGNHCTCIDPNHPERTQQILSNLVYLQDSSVDIDGVKIYGSPWRPKRGYVYRAEAFGYDASRIQIDKWSHLPSDVDILMTHGPPYSIRDFNPSSGKRVGCPGLLEEIITRVKPSISIFGHMHDCHGASLYRSADNENLMQFYQDKHKNTATTAVATTSTYTTNDETEILFLNAAMVGGHHLLRNPIVFDFYY